VTIGHGGRKLWFELSLMVLVAVLLLQLLVLPKAKRLQTSSSLLPIHGAEQTHACPADSATQNNQEHFRPIHGMHLFCTLVSQVNEREAEGETEGDGG